MSRRMLTTGGTEIIEGRFGSLTTKGAKSAKLKSNPDQAVGAKNLSPPPLARADI